MRYVSVFAIIVLVGATRIDAQMCAYSASVRRLLTGRRRKVRCKR